MSDTEKKWNEIAFNRYKSFDNSNSIIIPVDNAVTLIIGRNNTGKSSLIDVIEAACSFASQTTGVGGIKYSITLDEEHIKRDIGFKRKNTFVI